MGLPIRHRLSDPGCAAKTDARLPYQSAYDDSTDKSYAENRQPDRNRSFRSPKPEPKVALLADNPENGNNCAGDETYNETRHSQAHWARTRRRGAMKRTVYHGAIHAQSEVIVPSNRETITRETTLAKFPQLVGIICLFANALKK